MIPVIVVMFAMAIGAWLKYATGPVVAAYEVGKRVEAVHQRVRRTGR